MDHGRILAFAAARPLDLDDVRLLERAATVAALAITKQLAVMAVELVGVSALPHVAIVCGLAYLMTGHRGIYRAQRVARGKWGGVHQPPIRLEPEQTPPKSRAASGTSSKSFLIRVRTFCARR